MSAAVSQDKFFYGGQAVLEGVMMRGRTTYAVAVRKPDGEIQVLRERLLSVIYTHPIWKLPLLRGLAGLWEQLHLGMKALMWSANIQAAAEQIELSANPSASPWRSPSPARCSFSSASPCSPPAF